MLSTIKTFKELQEYIAVLLEVLDFIRLHYNNPKFKDGSTGDICILKRPMGTYKTVISLHKGIYEIASLTYCRPELLSKPFAIQNAINHIIINGNYNNMYNGFSYTSEKLPMKCIEDIQFDVPYSEDTYEQLKFLHPDIIVNTIMVFSKLSSSKISDTSQFFISERGKINFTNVLKEMKEMLDAKQD